MVMGNIKNLLEQNVIKTPAELQHEKEMIEFNKRISAEIEHAKKYVEEFIRYYIKYGSDSNSISGCYPILNVPVYVTRRKTGLFKHVNEYYAKFAETFIKSLEEFDAFKEKLRASFVEEGIDTKVEKFIISSYRYQHGPSQGYGRERWYYYSGFKCLQHNYDSDWGAEFTEYKRDSSQESYIPVSTVNQCNYYEGGTRDYYLIFALCFSVVIRKQD